MRTFLFCSLLSVCVPGISQTPAPQDAPGFHLETTPDGKPVQTNYGLKQLQQLIDDAQGDFKALVSRSEKQGIGTPQADRIILTDECTAGDQWEHEQIGEGGLVLLLAITKDPRELPLVNVRIERSKGDSVQMAKVAELSSGEALKLKFDGTYGTHAWCALYWMAKQKFVNGKVFADFSANRKDFSTGVAFPFDSQMGSALTSHKGGTPTLNLWALNQIIRREYPALTVDPWIVEGAQKAVPEKKQAVSSHN